MGNHSEPIRVAVLATHPIQYHAPLWRRVAADPRLAVRVFFGSDLGVRGYRDREFGVQVQWDTPLTAGYAHEFLEQDERLHAVSFRRPAGRQVEASLGRFAPDVVLLTAYNSLLQLRGLGWARANRVPVVLRHEASDAAHGRSAVKAALRDALLRGLYAQIARFAAIGGEARRHLRRLGVPTHRIGFAPYCIDSDLFAEQIREWEPRRAERRRQLGIGDGEVAVLFCGKLVEKKQPLLLAEAIAALPDAVRCKLHLLVIGEGELRGRLTVAAGAALGRRFHCAGFVNQSELGQWYTAADIAVLPSARGAGETWGLVVNEAMQFGLPVIASDAVGCRDDLVTGETGRVFPAGDARALAAKLEEVAATLPAGGSTWRAATRARVARYDLAAAAAGLTEALVLAADRKEQP